MFMIKPDKSAKYEEMIILGRANPDFCFATVRLDATWQLVLEALLMGSQAACRGAFSRGRVAL
jgi:hypothetical protein